MKTIVLYFALAVSLGSNAWFLIRRDAADPASRGAVSSGAAAGRSSTGGPAVAASAARPRPADAPAVPVVWKSPALTNDALRAFAAELRGAGFPPDAVVRIVGEMLRARTFAAIEALPPWQLMAPGKETRRLQGEAARELLRLQEEILGPSGSQVATLDPLTRQHRFGALADDKVAALLRIERDYEELRADMFSSSAIGRDEMNARQEQMRTLEKERLADITAVLTPEEFADWDRRESPEAKRVMFALRDVTATETEYLALLEAQKTRAAASGGSGGASPFNPLPTDLPATFGFVDQVRATLGEERGGAYLKLIEPLYAQAASFTEKDSTLGPNVAYELFKLQSEAQASMIASRGPDGTIDVERRRREISDLNARLETLLGPERAEAYRKQGVGMIFRAANVLPPDRRTNATGSPTTVPAVRLPGGG